MCSVVRQLRVELSDDEWSRLKALVALSGTTMQEWLASILKDEIQTLPEKART